MEYKPHIAFYTFKEFNMCSRKVKIEHDTVQKGVEEYLKKGNRIEKLPDGARDGLGTTHIGIYLPSRGHKPSVSNEDVYISYEEEQRKRALAKWNKHREENNAKRRKKNADRKSEGKLSVTGRPV